MESRKRDRLELVRERALIVNHKATGGRARSIRKARRVSLSELAAKLNLSISQLSNLEKGKRSWTDEYVERYNKALEEYQ